MKAKILAKKKLILCAAAVLLAIAVTLCLLFSCGSNKGSNIEPPSSSLSVSMAPPDDGSAPGDHTGIENIAYIIGKLSSREYFHSETVGEVEASVLFITAGQTIYGSKDYKDGIYLTSSVSISNNAFAPSKAIQRFYGDKKVVVRGSASSDTSTWTGSDVAWSDGEPLEILDEAQYEDRYGLWASEFSDYVINESTVLDVTPVEQDGNGNYVMTATLDNADATYYYKHQMKTMGNLDDYPVFSSVKLTFTFGADWTIYSLTIDEEYTSKKGVDASCVGHSVITFSYGESDADVSDYESYFINYANAAATGGEDKEYTATDYLTYGFAAFLTDEVALDADISVGDRTFAAQIALDMRGLSLHSLKGKIGDLAFSYEGDKIAVMYKEIAGYLKISDLSALLGEDGSFALDTDALMDQLTNGELVKDGENVTLSATLDLGGMQIPVQFGFIEKEGEVSFGHIGASLQISGLDISVMAQLADSVPEISVPDTAVDLMPFVQNIMSLISGKEYAIEISYADAESGLSIAGELSLDVREDVKAWGKLTLSAGEVTVPAEFAYINDTIYVRAYNIKLQSNVTEAKELAERIMSLVGEESVPELGGLEEKELSEILGEILGLNFGEMVKGVSLTDGGFGAVINADELLSALVGEKLSLGEIMLEYELSANAFGAEVLGAELALSAGDKEITVPADAEEYVSLSLVTELLPAAESIVKSGSAGFAGELTVLLGGSKLCLAVSGDVNFADGLEAYIVLRISAKDGSETEGKLCYKQGELYVQLFGVTAKVTEGELKELVTLFAESGAEADGSAEGMEELLSELDVNGLLESLKILDGESGLEVLADLSKVFGGAANEIVLKLGADGEKLQIASDKLSVFGVTAEEIKLTVGAGTGETEFPTDGAVDIYPHIAKISELISGKEYAIEISYADAESGLSIAGELSLDVREGVKAWGKLTLSAGEVAVPAEFAYINDTIYVKAYNIKLQSNVTEAKELAERIMSLVGEESLPELGGLEEQELSEILGEILGLNFGELVKGVTLTDGGFGAVINADELLSALVGEKLSLGEIMLEYELSANAFGAEVLGAELALSAGDKEITVPADAEEYVSLSLVTELLPAAESIVKSGSAGFAGELTVLLGGSKLCLAVSGDVNFADGLEAYIVLRISAKDGSETEVKLCYKQGELYVQLFGVTAKVTEGELKELVTLFTESGAEADGSAEGMEELLSELDVNGLLESLKILDGESGLEVVADLSKVFGGDANEVGIKIGAEGEKLQIASDKLSVFGVTAEEIKLTVGAGTGETEFPTDGAVDIYPHIAKISELISGKEYAIEISYADAESGLSVAGELSLDVREDVKAWGKLTLSAGEVTIPAEFAYINDTIYVKAYNIKLQSGVTEVKELAERIMNLVGEESVPELGGLEEKELSEILGEILGLNFGELVKGVSLTDGGFGAVINADELLSALVGEELSLGEITLEYELSANAFGAEVLGAELALSAGDKEITVPADAEEYVSLSLVTELLPAAESIVKSESAGFAGELTVQLGGSKLCLAVSGDVNFADGLEAYIVLRISAKDGSETEVKLCYKQGELYVQLFGVTAKVTEGELKELVTLFTESGAEADGSAEGMEELLSELDVNGLLESLKILDGESGLEVVADLSKVFGGDANEVGIKIGAEGEELQIASDKLSVFGITAEEIKLTVGAGTGETEFPTDGAVDIYPHIAKIAELISGKEYAIEISYADAESGLSVAGELSLDVREGVKAWGKLTLSAGEVTVPAEFAYINDTIYVKAYNIKLQSGVTEAKELTERIMNLVGEESLPELGGLEEKELSEILGEILGLNFGELVKGVSLTDGGFGAVINADELLSALVGEEISLGEIALEYELSANAFGAEVLGAELALSAGDKEITVPADAEEYVSLSLVTELLPAAESIVKSGSAGFAGELTVLLGGSKLCLAVSGDVNFADGLEAYIVLRISAKDGSETEGKLCYKQGELYVQLFGVTAKVTEGELKELVTLFTESGAEADGSAEGMEELLSELDVNGLLESLKILDGESGLEVVADLSKVFGGDANEVGIKIGAEGEELQIASDKLSVFGITAEEIKLTVGAGTGETEFPTDGAVDIYPHIAKIAELISGKEYAIEISYADAESGLSVAGELSLDVREGVKAWGKLTLSAGEVTVPAEFAYINDTIYVKAYNIKLQSGVTEAKELTERIMNLVGEESLPELGGLEEKELSEILGEILGLNFGELVKGVSLTDGGFGAVINADELLSALVGEEISLGEIALEYELSANAFGAEVLGAELALSAGDKEITVPADAEEYVSLSLVTELLPAAESIVKSGSAGFAGELTVLLGGSKLCLAVSGDVNFADGLEAYIVLRISAKDGSETEGKLCYKQGELYVQLFGVTAKVTEGELKELVTLFTESGAEADGSAEGMEELLSELDVNGLLESLKILDGESGLEVLADLSKVFGGDANEIVLKLGADGEKLQIASDKLSVFGVTAEEIKLTVGAGTGETEFPTDGAVDIYPHIAKIAELISGKEYAIEISYADAESGLSVAGELSLDVREGVKAWGKLTLSAGEVTVPAEFAYINDTIYVKAYNIKLQSGVTEAKELTERIMNLVGEESLPELGGLEEKELSEILGEILGLNFGELVKGVTLTDGGFGAVINADELLSALVGEELSLGEITLEYELSANAFGAEVLGAELALSAGDKEITVPADAEEYVSLSLVTELLPAAESIVKSESAGFAGELTVLLGGSKLGLSLSGDVNFADGLEAYIVLRISAKDGSETEGKLCYKQGELYVQLFGVTAKVTEGELKELVTLFTESGAEADGSAEGMEELLSELDVNGLLESLKILDGESGLEVLADLSKVFGGDANEIVLKLGADGEKLQIASDKLSVFGVTAEEIKLTVGAGTGETEFPTDGAVDIYPHIAKIAELISGKEYAIEISYAEEESGLSIAGELSLDVREDVKAWGRLTLSAGEVTVPAEIAYINDTIYVKAYNIKLQSNVTEAKELAERIMNLVGEESVPELGGLEEQELSEILGEILGLNFGELVKGVSLTDGGFGAVINADELLSALVGEELSLGEITLEYELSANAFGAEVLGAELALSAGDKEITVPADAEEYVSLSLVTQFIDPVNAIIQSKGAAVEAAFDLTIEEISMHADIAAEARFYDDGTFGSLIAYIDLSVVEGRTEQLRLYYQDGNVVLGYQAAGETMDGVGYKMNFTPEEFDRIQSEIAGLIGSTPDQGARGAMAFLGELDLNALIGSLRLLSGEAGALSLIADLSSVFGEGNESFAATLKVLENGTLFASVPSVSLLGFADVRALELYVAPVPAESGMDLAFMQWSDCDNIFEFILVAYTEIFDTEYLGFTLGMDSDTLSVQAEGRVQFERSGGENASVTLNMQLRAHILSGGTSHYLQATLLRDMFWASYSVIGFDADTALSVSIPVSELFVAGSTVLPILGPILGIDEGTYYYNFVNSILTGYSEMSEYYNTINSDIFGLELYEGQTAFNAWVDLLVGIVKEYTGTEQEQADKAAKAAEGESSSAFVYGKSEAGNYYAGIAADGMDVKLYALKASETLESSYILQGEDTPIEAPAGEYIDLSSIAQLLNDVLYAYNYKDFGYHLTGSASMSVDLIGLSIPLDLSVQIDAQIDVSESGEVQFNIRLTTGGYENILLLFTGDRVAINGDTVTDITFTNGNIYMHRVQTTYYNNSIWVWEQGFKTLGEPYVDDRAMTFEYFMGSARNMIDQIFFAINMSSSLGDFIIEQAGLNEPETDTGTGSANPNDAGQMVTSYNAVYSGETLTGYELGLDLGAIVNDDAIGAVNISIARRDNGDGTFDLGSIEATLTFVDFITLHVNLQNETMSDFASEITVSPEEYAELVASGEWSATRHYAGSVDSALGIVCGAFGCSDISVLESALASSENGYMEA